MPSNYENTLKLCQNYKNKFSLPKRLIDSSFEAMKFDLSNVEVLQPLPNLTREERVALQRLKHTCSVLKDGCMLIGLAPPENWDSASTA